MEAKEIERLVACAELRNPKQFNASRERYIAEISFKAGYDKRESEFVYNPDYLNFTKGVQVGKMLGSQLEEYMKHYLKDWFDRTTPSVV